METDGRQVIIAVADDARASAAKSAGEEVLVLCGSADVKQQGSASWPAVGDQITVKLTPAGEPASYCLAEDRQDGDLACVTFDKSRDWCQTSPKDTGTVEDLVIE
ncbi:MAG: hypothetical protein ACSLFR_03860 [Solirubrobacteraceae bacterium]